MNIKRIFATILFAVTFAVGIVGSGLIAANGATQPLFENANTATGPVTPAGDGGTTVILLAESWGGGNIGREGHMGIEGTRDAWIPIVAPALPIRTASMFKNSRMSRSGSNVTGNDLGVSTSIVTSPD